MSPRILASNLDKKWLLVKSGQHQSNPPTRPVEIRHDQRKLRTWPVKTGNDHPKPKTRPVKIRSHFRKPQMRPAKTYKYHPKLPTRPVERPRPSASPRWRPSANICNASRGRSWSSGPQRPKRIKFNPGWRRINRLTRIGILVCIGFEFYPCASVCIRGK